MARIWKNVKDAAGHAVDGIWSSPVLDLFKTGNVIQLISRSSGKVLQLEHHIGGSPTLAARGHDDPNNTSANWTVINVGRNVVQLRHDNYFIFVKNGTTGLKKCEDSALVGDEAKFYLTQTGDFVFFESYVEHGSHIGSAIDGTIKEAKTTVKDIDGEFGVRLVNSETACAAEKKEDQEHKKESNNDKEKSKDKSKDHDKEKSKEDKEKAKDKDKSKDKHKEKS